MREEQTTGRGDEILKKYRRGKIMDKVSNIDVRKELNVKSFRNTVENNRLMWLILVKRMKDGTIIKKKTQKTKEYGNQPRGRPR